MRSVHRWWAVPAWRSFHRRRVKLPGSEARASRCVSHIRPRFAPNALPRRAPPPAALRHRPWDATPEQAEAAGFSPGRSYPNPMVPPASQIGEGPKPRGGRGGGGGGAASQPESQQRGRQRAQRRRPQGEPQPRSPG
jgi:hypothetical protein